MAIYYVYSGAGGSNNGSSWANAFTTLTTAFATEVAGDTLYVAHDHAESTAATITLTSSGTVSNPTKIICVDRAGSVPPVSADRRATAQVSTTGASHINITGFAHYDGIIFTAGNSTNVANIVVPAAGGTCPWVKFDNCSLRLGGSGAGAINIANLGSTIATYVELNNTTMSFAAVGQTINTANAFRWRNTASALIGAAVPTNLFNGVSGRGIDVECIGVDFSAAGSGKSIINATGVANAGGGRLRFVDCKLNASVSKMSAAAGSQACDVDFVRSGSSGVNYYVYRSRVAAALNEETTVVRTGGASDGTTPIAWKIDTTANCNYSMPFECPPIAIWNDTTGSAKTATVEGIWGGGAVPNDDEIWLDVEYLGDASSPQGSFINDAKADLIASAAGQTSSAASWGGSTTKFKLEVTFTPQQKGWLYARVKAAKASSTFYIDPLVTLT